MLSGANNIPQKEVMDWVTNRVYSFNSGELIHEGKSDGNGNYDLTISTDDYISVVYMDIGNINIRPRVVGPTLADEYEDIPWE